MRGERETFNLAFCFSLLVDLLSLQIWPNNDVTRKELGKLLIHKLQVRVAGLALSQDAKSHLDDLSDTTTASHANSHPGAGTQCVCWGI